MLQDEERFFFNQSIIILILLCQNLLFLLLERLNFSSRPSTPLYSQLMPNPSYQRSTPLRKNTQSSVNEDKKGCYKILKQSI